MSIALIFEVKKLTT